MPLTATIKSEDLTWTRTNAHLAIADECKSVQNDVGVIDISGSSKFMVSGKDANKFLNFLKLEYYYFLIHYNL